LPEELRFSVFDCAYNSGVSRAIKTLQRVVGVAEDGKLGPVTLAAVATLDPARAVARFNGVRLAFMVSLDVWPTFSRGWALRIADNLLGA
jgi:lysozyme family protein